MFMRRLMGGLGVLLVGLIAALFIWSQPTEDEGPVDAAALSYYRESYDESRAAFRGLAATGGLLESYRVPSAFDEDLTIDVLYYPPTVKTERLLILTSGVHGIEGFTGSAVQRYFVERILPDLDRSELGVLVVHAVNPFGFRYERRVSENNVDLNRNWDVDPALFQIKNEGYASLYPMLNPKDRVDLASWGNRFFFMRAIRQIIEYGMPALRQGILQGQYGYPAGIFFGGKTFEPQKGLLEPLFKRRAAPYRQVLFIDLHTGYGKRGKLHLFPNAIEDVTLRNRLETIFEGYTIDYGDREGFYTATGSFVDYAGKLLSDKVYMPMVFEYGTLDSQTISGSIRSLHNMIIENQGYWYGYRTEEDERETKRRFREHFFPSSPVWRTRVIHDSDALLRHALANFQKLP